MSGFGPLPAWVVNPTPPVIGDQADISSSRCDVG